MKNVRTFTTMRARVVPLSIAAVLGVSIAVSGAAVTPTATAVVFNGAKVLSEARALIGTPYAFGAGHGATPGVTYGKIDCSGLLRLAYYRAGLGDLGTGGTRDQIHLFDPVPASSAVPGDAIFYGRRVSSGVEYRDASGQGWDVQHVAIYTGSRRIDALPDGGVAERPLSTSMTRIGYFHLRGAALPPPPPPPPPADPRPLWGKDDGLTRAATVAYLHRYSNDPLVRGNDYADHAESVALNWAVETGLSAGFTGSGGPDAVATRGHVAAFLYRLTGASFVAPPSPSFSDVPTTHTFFREIEWLKAAGITGGCGGGQFCPGQQVSKFDLIVMLHRLAGNHVPPNVPSSSPYRDINATLLPTVIWSENAFITAEPFTDVPRRAVFSTEVRWASAQGIAAGYSDGTFRPFESVTRRQMAALLYQASGSPDFEPPTTPSFSDVGTSHPNYLQIEWLVSQGITGGHTDGTFRPTGNVLRGAAATMLYRLADQPGFSAPPTPSFVDVASQAPMYTEIEWAAAVGVAGGYPDGSFRPSTAVTRGELVAFLYRFARLT